MPKLIDLTGQRFGRLSSIGRVENYRPPTMTRGESMKRARRRAGLTLRQLEERSGIRAGTISRLEQDKQEGMLSTVSTLAAALGLSVDEYTGNK